MKTLKIYKRTILVRTGFKKYPYKSETQYTLIYNGEEFKNHYEDINNKRLKIPFEKVLETRKTADVVSFVDKLGRTESDKFIKKIILDHIL